MVLERPVSCAEMTGEAGTVEDSAAQARDRQAKVELVPHGGFPEQDLTVIVRVKRI
jgi:hypothetical protein